SWSMTLSVVYNPLSRSIWRILNQMFPERPSDSAFTHNVDQNFQRFSADFLLSTKSSCKSSIFFLCSHPHRNPSEISSSNDDSTLPVTHTHTHTHTSHPITPPIPLLHFSAVF